MPKWRLDSTMHSIDKSYMEPVAQWVERQFVALVVAGSNPVGLPTASRFYRDVEISQGFAKVTLPQSPDFYCKIYRISLIILRL